MDDRFGESCKLCVCGLNVEGIQITVKSIKNSLVRECFFLENEIVWPFRDRRKRSKFASRLDSRSSQRSDKGDSINIVS